MNSTSTILRTLRYEGARLACTRSTRGAALVAVVVSALLTLPAARSLGGLFARPGAAASVVAGGTAGAVIPAGAACLAAAWIGASAIADEYRFGRVLFTYVLLPKRACVLLGKALAAAACGVLLCALANLSAYGTARLGFTVASVKATLPAQLLIPGPAGIAAAALAGVLGVLAAAVLRVRLFATAAALAGVAALATALPHSTSPLKRYTASGTRLLAQYAPHVPAFSVPLAAGIIVAGCALLAIRLRRVV